MRIVWDERKRQLNLAKHGLDFADLDIDFFVSALVLPAHSGRQRAIGWLDETLVVLVVFQPLGSQAISIVSLRPASKHERLRHEQGV